jgi:hypothetical protein
MDVRLYDIPSGSTLLVSPDAGYVPEVRIHDDVIVWLEGVPGSTRVRMLNVTWSEWIPVDLSGQTAAVALDVGQRLVVWEGVWDGQSHIVAYDMISGSPFLPVPPEPFIDKKAPGEVDYTGR